MSEDALARMVYIAIFLMLLAGVCYFILDGSDYERERASIEEESARNAQEFKRHAAATAFGSITGGSETVSLPSADPSLPSDPALWIAVGPQISRRVICEGVWLYFDRGLNLGKSKEAEVVGENDSYLDPETGQFFQGIKVRYRSGHTKWLDRYHLEYHPDFAYNPWYVRKNDPALLHPRHPFCSW